MKHSGARVPVLVVSIYDKSDCDAVDTKAMKQVAAELRTQKSKG